MSTGISLLDNFVIDNLDDCGRSYGPSARASPRLLALQREKAELRGPLAEAQSKIETLTAEVARLDEAVARGNERLTELLVIAQRKQRPGKAETPPAAAPKPLASLTAEEREKHANRPKAPPHPKNNGYIEAFRNDPMVVFQYEPHKGSEALASKLASFEGVLVADAERDGHSPSSAREAASKAKAEVGVQIVQRWFLARLRKETHFSMDSLNERIVELLDELMPAQ